MRGHAGDREFRQFLSILSALFLSGCLSGGSGGGATPLVRSAPAPQKAASADANNAGSSAVDSVPLRLTADGRILQPGEEPLLWFAPMPFINSPTPKVRNDFNGIASNANSWASLRKKGIVFKGYLMLMHPESQANLDAMVRAVNQFNLPVAFEVGGLRTSRHCGFDSGIRHAEEEFTVLKRWLAADNNRGRIDFITSDHAVAESMAAPIRGTSPFASTTCRMTMEELNRELVKYFVYMKQKIPGLRVGVIESLGYWTFNDSEYGFYGPSDSRLPQWPFQKFLDNLLATANSAKLKIDHFHIDFGRDGTEVDARNAQRGLRIDGLDFGRMGAALKIVHSAGLRSGVILNSFESSELSASSNTDARNRSAVDRTLAFTRSWMKTKFGSHALLLQSWMHHPNRTGSESDSLSQIGMMTSQAEVIAGTATNINEADAPLSEGLFKMGLTIAYANAQAHYCIFDTWENFERAVPNYGDVNLIRSVGRIPNAMSYDGICQVPSASPPAPSSTSGFAVASANSSSNQPPISAGLFRLNGTTVGYSNGARYCLFNSWATFEAAFPNNTNLSTIRNLASIPSGMPNDGVCAAPAAPPIPAGLFRIGTVIGYSNGSHYCTFNSWERYLASFPAHSNVNQLTNYAEAPASMVSDGICI